MGQPIAGSMANAAPAIVNEVDDEWEYEYDPEDTEDFYITVDLTTHAPDALVRKSSTNGSHEANGTVRRPPSREEDDDEDDDGEEEQNEDDISSNPVGRLQIIDLHTTNPLVKFDSEVFSTYWSTDIGTQVHIAQAGETKTPRRAGTVLDIVGTSQTRLIGKPVLLKQREDVEDAEPQRQQELPTDGLAETRDESESQADDHSRYSTPQAQAEEAGQVLEIPRDLSNSRTERQQASFLERLSEAKLKKGENDAVPLYGVRTYEPPKDANEIRQRDIAAEAFRIQQAKDEELAAKGDRPRKRRRKLTHAEKGVERVCGKVPRETVAASSDLQDRPSSSPPHGASGESGPVQVEAGTPVEENDDVTGKE